MEYKFIRTETRDHRFDILINNPPMNILTGAVMQEIIQVLEAIKEDKQYRAVVFSGEGKAWSAGADVSEHLPGSFDQMLKVFGKLCELVRSFPIPTFAAVNGLCLGGGCELAAMCDFIIASEKAKFGQPEIKVGVFPPVALAHFAWKYGYCNAMEIILTGDVFDASRSEELGLVNHLVPVENFNENVDKFVSRFTSNSGAVLRSSKKAGLLSLAHTPLESAEFINEIYSKELMSTSDSVEGLNAFLERRKPEWKDK
ncbi:enoyl-CoA hydratase/isomerase family protein [bacterium]|nr:enoyl-CoA hydratase/isomerase family protein [bacterium]